LVAETAAIPVSEPATGLTPNAFAQILPFQCSSRVDGRPMGPVAPTAQALPAEMAATPFSWPPAT
jgi:hypothetical protein